MTEHKIILASKSPRRIEIFNEHGIFPEVIPSEAEEIVPILLSPHEIPMFLSLKKALDVFDRDETAINAIIVASDTVVTIDGEIMGKPENEEAAFDMLSKLRRRTHEVISGVCVICQPENIKECFFDSTKVTFSNYSDDELRSYLKTPEAYDKAGAYAIQGTFGRYVTGIDGSLLNVIGFPWEKFESFMKNSFGGAII